MTQVIYKIINLVNDKFYVGSTTNQKVRFRQHRTLLRGNRHHCKHLQTAWNKYGESKFSFVVVEEVPDTRSLQEIEDTYLMKHVGQRYCYNTGYRSDAPWRGAPKEATPNFGRAMAQTQKEDISKSLKVFYAADYNNHPRVGKAHTAETKAKISQNRAGKQSGADHYRFGQVLPDEMKARIGDKQRGVAKPKGRKVSPAGMEKIHAAAKAGNYSHWEGRNHTEESKAKMRKGVTEITTNTKFDSLSAALVHYGMTMPTLSRALKSALPISKGKFAGLHFFYI